MKTKDMGHKPGEVYMEKTLRGTFGGQTYGVFIEGDDTMEGGTVTLGLFPSEELAWRYFKNIEHSDLVEQIRKDMFRHPEKEIAIDPNISISSEEWAKKNPELVKYQGNEEHSEAASDSRPPVSREPEVRRRSRKESLINNTGIGPGEYPDL